jgi:voltage-gated potassium channel
VVIDQAEQNVRLADKLGYQIIQADASNNQVLENAGINKGANAILCTTGNDVTNVYVTLTSRNLNAGINIISRANRSENVKKLIQAGADHVIQPFETSGLLAAEYVGQPVAFEAILGILHKQTHVQIDTVTVLSQSLLEDQSVAAIDFIQRKLSLVGVISRNPIHRKHKDRYQVRDLHFYFNPEAHFMLLDGDMLVLLGREYSIEHFRTQIEKSRLNVSPE